MHTRSWPFLFVVGLLSACAARHAEPAPVETSPPPVDDALPDGGEAAPDDAGPPPEAVPVTALVEILQLTPAAGELSVSANSGFVDVAAQSLSAQAGDRLRIRGQVEWTNDFALPVAGASELVVDGKVVAPVTYQNNVQLGTHHTVLYQSASVVIPTDGAHRVALRFSAGESGASPTVTVEAAQYTQLIVEHYRTFPSAAAAAAAGAYLLRGVAESHAALVTTYGATPSALEKIYQVTTPALLQGDVVRLSAQTTSAWNAGNPQLFEMHGTAIHVDGKTQQQLSAWASENTPYDVNVTPLWTDGSYRVPADGKYQFDVTMHGVFGVGGLVEGAEGHLSALVFSPTASLALALSETTAANKDVSSTANAPRLTVVSRDLDVVAGAIARLEGTLELSLAAGAQLNPACEARLTLRDPKGGIVRTGSALKYLTSGLGSIALRTELVLAPATAGTYKVELSIGCTRSGENTPFVVSGAGARILADLFAPTP